MYRAYKSFVMFLLLHAVLFVSTTAVYAEDILLDGLAGPAFTDPSKITDMPAEWKEQPIKYDPAIGEADIVITLDQHIYPALLPGIEKYAGENNIKIHGSEGTCGITAGMLSRKAVDIGGFCCPPDVTDRLPGLKFHTIGISSLAIFVHPDNPIDSITFEEARKIFMGEINSWSEIRNEDGEAGLNMPIEPIGRLHCKLRPGHWRLILDNEDLFGTNLQEVGNIPDMFYKVASNKSAIGYGDIWNLIRYKDKGEVKALKINGYSPYGTANLISGKYPLYRVFNLTSWEGKNSKKSQIQKLIEYLILKGEQLDREHNIAPASSLRIAGWKFKDSELIGEPE